MSKIRVKNFGPIKEGFNEDDGFLDVKKVTVFIGDQGAGKSTLAKLISTFTWLEKAMNRGEVSEDIEEIDLIQYFFYQGIQNYSLPDEVSEIEYIGEAYKIAYNKKLYFLKVEAIKNGWQNYKVPKIVYVPAERNFLSIIKNAFNIKGLPGALFSFAEELKRSQREIGDKSINLPFSDYNYSYDKGSDLSFLEGEKHSYNLAEASSGLQSTIPLYIVSRNLALSIKEDVDVKDIYNSLSALQSLRLDEEVRQLAKKKFISDEERKHHEKVIIAKYHNTCFINIVEEPEQNLFPESQRYILNSLLGFANKQEANELLMTTHSPYIINYLSIAIQGKYLLNKINTSSKKEELLPRLNEIVPIEVCVAAEDVAFYQFQNDGSICRLGNYEGIPSDKNYLNQSLAEGNQLFDALLELEEEL